MTRRPRKPDSIRRGRVQPAPPDRPPAPSSSIPAAPLLPPIPPIPPTLRSQASHETGLEPDLRELRSSIANLRAAAEALAADAGPRRRGATAAAVPDGALLSAVIEEAERASWAVGRLTSSLSGPAAAKAGSGIADAIPAARLAAEIARRAACELDLAVHLDGAIDAGLSVAPAFVQPILGALARLRRDFSVSEAALSVRRHDDLLSLEIAFAAREPEASRLREEHDLVLAEGPGGEPALGAGARAAGGEAWLSIRRGEATFALRLLLPLGPAA